MVVDDDGVSVRLRLPASSRSSAAAHLLVSDSLDALRGVEGIDRAAVVIEDHPGSAAINGYVLAESWPRRAPYSVDFARRAYLAAAERSIALHLMMTGERTDRIGSLTLRDIRGERYTTALLRRRSALGLSICPNSRLCVDENGRVIAQQNIRIALTITAPPGQ
ncbi:hypothetical protein [Rhodococcus sp. SORGH_AS_0301]|uniref:hypothetical protein n=1 Tax=Rhodococcus sp. SORGH_AS_0301 TaxID=3041780 RepID=UPI002782D795|nr:hypothetical protein [Rhodococcus sp. SORGH_AS_0301]MDQ1178593.1 hypothetical protein [Rhodococcus sp. SORGH_AS_0301]